VVVAAEIGIVAAPPVAAVTPFLRSVTTGAVTVVAVVMSQ
jgi:hypothetical protein